VCAEKVEIQAAWRCENDISPSSAHMYQRMPPLIVVTTLKFNHIEIEHFQEGLIGERSDGDLSVKWAYTNQTSVIIPTEDSR
jgi:hypothetical protein